MSTLAVASSKIKIDFLFSKARAKQINYFCPDENNSSVTSSSSNLGNFNI